jgi:hypothetical protein
VSPAEAVSLDIEALVTMTNPALKETLTLSGLKAIPRLSTAVQLLEQLAPGSLRTALKDALVQWPGLNEGCQERFLAKANDCAEALRFAKSMAARYPTGVVGCLGGALACAGVWSGCLLVFGTNLSLWGWLGILGGGIVAGTSLSRLLVSGRDRRWIREVLLPEADRAQIHLGWVLAVLEGGGFFQRGGDELASLRELAPTIRAEMPSSDKADEEIGFTVESARR